MTAIALTHSAVQNATMSLTVMNSNSIQVIIGIIIKQVY